MPVHRACGALFLDVVHLAAGRQLSVTPDQAPASQCGESEEPYYASHTLPPVQRFAIIMPMLSARGAHQQMTLTLRNWNIFLRQELLVGREVQRAYVTPRVFLAHEPTIWRSRADGVSRRSSVVSPRSSVVGRQFQSTVRLRTDDRRLPTEQSIVPPVANSCMKSRSRAPGRRSRSGRSPRGRLMGIKCQPGSQPDQEIAHIRTVP